MLYGKIIAYNCIYKYIIYRIIPVVEKCIFVSFSRSDHKLQYIYYVVSIKEKSRQNSLRYIYDQKKSICRSVIGFRWDRESNKFYERLSSIPEDPLLYIFPVDLTTQHKDFIIGSPLRTATFYTSTTLP